jgi:hypothetical protein
MRDTQGDCSRQGSRRSPRLSNPVEQTGIMGKGRAVPGNDRPALSATPDYTYFICNQLQIFQAEFSLGVREWLVKTVATFSKPEEAHLFRTRLEAAGIPAYVQDEHFIQMNWLYSNAVGGVRVQIADEDLDAAREFLASDSPQPSPEAVDVVCPKCGSHDTAPDELPRRISFLSLLLINFPVLFARHRWRCASCHYVFRCHPANA